MSCVIGIDPGLSGGVALYDLQAQTLVEVRPIPVLVKQNGRYKDTSVDTRELGYMIGTMVEAHDVVMIVVEQVHSSPQMGVASAFKFGQGFGEVKMACEIYCDTVDFVSPQRWKARMMLSFDKKQSLAMARKLYGKEWFPKEKHEGLAEAALIATYAGRFIDLPTPTDEEDDPLS